MKELYVFDDKNYDPTLPRSRREAVRAAIFNEQRNMLAMAYSEKEGFYKFPGGGIEPGESREQALIREVREEVGLVVKPESIREFGYIREIRYGILYENEIFDHISNYYFALVEEGCVEQKLDPYEEDLKYRMVWVPLKEAFSVNSIKGLQYKSKFILRDAKALELLINETDQS